MKPLHGGEDGGWDNYEFVIRLPRNVVNESMARLVAA